MSLNAVKQQRHDISATHLEYHGQDISAFIGKLGNEFDWVIGTPSPPLVLQVKYL